MTKKNVVNKELERLWKIWCKARNCDVTGQQSLNQILRMAVVRKKVDGGILFVKRYTRDGILPFSLQMLEVDELDSMHVMPEKNGNRVVGGIEYNTYNPGRVLDKAVPDRRIYNRESGVSEGIGCHLLLHEETSESDQRDVRHESDSDKDSRCQ